MVFEHRFNCSYLAEYRNNFDIGPRLISVLHRPHGMCNGLELPLEILGTVYYPILLFNRPSLWPSGISAHLGRNRS